MISSEELNALQNKIHAQNVEAGWWDEERSFATFICLFHSELSEAMEGDRKGLMDDHLPQYEMFWVELADFVIRCLDWLGSVGNTEYGVYSPDEVRDDVTNTLFLAYSHTFVADAYDPHRDKASQNAPEILADCACGAFAYAEKQGVDLLEIIEAKLAYNKTRADHKRENRAKEGGKRY